VAAGYMLKARHTKRMLAYSTLEVMGIVAIALGIGGAGVHAAILLLIVHSLTKAGLFYQLSQMFRIFHTYMLKEVGNYFQVNPLGSMVLLTGLIGILAIPPSGLFRPEFMVFTELANKDYWLLMILMFVFLAFLVYGMSIRMMHVLFSPRIEGHHAITLVKADIAEIVIQMILLLAAMSLCFYEPVFLERLIDQAIQMK
jgi:hydrogenase-4 component F